MIRHVIIRQLTEGTTPEQIALMEKNTRAFTEIPGIRAVETGGNLNLVPRSEGYDHLTIIDMDGPEVLPGFIAHPLHDTAASFSKGLTARSLIFDLELS